MHFFCIYIENLDFWILVLTLQPGCEFVSAGSEGLINYVIIPWCRATWASCKINYTSPAPSLIHTNVSYWQQPWWLLLGFCDPFPRLSSLNSETCHHKPDSKVHGAIMGPSGADRTQVGPMLAQGTLLSGKVSQRLAATRLSKMVILFWTLTLTLVSDS